MARGLLPKICEAPETGDAGITVHSTDDRFQNGMEAYKAVIISARALFPAHFGTMAAARHVSEPKACWQIRGPGVALAATLVRNGRSAAGGNVRAIARAANLKFLSVPPRVRYRNFNSKAALESIPRFASEADLLANFGI